MAPAMRLQDFLRSQPEPGVPHRTEIGDTILSMVRAGRQIAELLASGPLTPDLAAHRGDTVQGDTQKDLDLRSNALMLDALKRAPVAWVASEELDEPLLLRDGAALSVAIDPLDGSSNIDTNAPVGTIFSILPTVPGADGASATFLRPGSHQLAAGFLIYGSQTALLLTLGEGTFLFTLDRVSGDFVCVQGAIRIGLAAQEYAINASNHRHWDGAVRRYIDECVAGREGPRGRDFNTRWIASLVAETYRIMVRGGIYLYPADSRPSYREGRLRLIYEASPIAWLAEQAGGAATDGRTRILDLVPRAIHQRIPLVFGAVEEVTRVASYYGSPDTARHEPLFGSRTLFRGGGGTAPIGSPACP